MRSVRPKKIDPGRAVAVIEAAFDIFDLYVVARKAKPEAVQAAVSRLQVAGRALWSPREYAAVVKRLASVWKDGGRFEHFLKLAAATKEPEKPRRRATLSYSLR